MAPTENVKLQWQYQCYIHPQFSSQHHHYHQILQYVYTGRVMTQHTSTFLCLYNDSLFVYISIFEFAVFFKTQQLQLFCWKYLIYNREKTRKKNNKKNMIFFEKKNSRLVMKFFITINKRKATDNNNLINIDLDNQKNPQLHERRHVHHCKYSTQ